MSCTAGCAVASGAARGGAGSDPAAPGSRRPRDHNDDKVVEEQVLPLLLRPPRRAAASILASTVIHTGGDLPPCTLISLKTFSFIRFIHRYSIPFSRGACGASFSERSGRAASVVTTAHNASLASLYVGGSGTIQDSGGGEGRGEGEDARRGRHRRQRTAARRRVPPLAGLRICHSAGLNQNCKRFLKTSHGCLSVLTRLQRE